MKISIIGGGAWGTTIGQLLNDNGHEILIYDINDEFVRIINNKHCHPFFEGHRLPDGVKATNNLKEAVDYTNYLVIAVPTKFIRDESLKKINKLINEPKLFINVSKGIEPETSKRVSEIVKEEIDKKNYLGYVAITGPSHAEEVIERKITVLVSASDNIELAKEVQLIFNNEKYLRVYTSDDLIGCEIGGAIKNAIAVISGVATGLGLGENARAALISRGVLEIVQIVTAMGGRAQTAFGLTGLGDLIVTASSENSRNFQAGKKIGAGDDVKNVLAHSIQTVEGIRTVKAAYEIGKKHKLELPIIYNAYEVLYNGMDARIALTNLLNRSLKME